MVQPVVVVVSVAVVVASFAAWLAVAVGVVVVVDAVLAVPASRAFPFLQELISVWKCALVLVVLWESLDQLSLLSGFGSLLFFPVWLYLSEAELHLSLIHSLSCSRRKKKRTKKKKKKKKKTCRSLIYYCLKSPNSNP